jgi:hypothetical protein
LHGPSTAKMESYRAEELVEEKEAAVCEDAAPRSRLLSRFFTCFSISRSELFTTPRLSHPFCSCIASIVLPRSELRSHVIVRRAELKARSQLQLVDGIERKSVAILNSIG